MKSGVGGWMRTLLWSMGWLGVGVLITFLYFHSQQVAEQSCVKKYSLTSHILDCVDYEDSVSRLKVLDVKFNKAVTLFIQQGKADRISVWARDLEAKQWAAYNEFDKYTPASLMKVPLMIAYYKVAEIQPTLLDTQLVYAQQSSDLNNSRQNFKPGNGLVLGQSYSVEQLIEHMIINSDNNAAALLLAHIDNPIFENTLVDLGIKVPIGETTQDFVTAKTYANIFRILYNASYLDHNYSEKVLELLSRTAFGGMADSIPASTVIAHKFGERELDNPDGSSQKRELHDCGIVYKGSRPYSLCIMTEGKNFDDLLSIIHDLSAIAYEQL